MLGDAACSIRGEKDAAKFKDYLLPLLSSNANPMPWTMRSTVWPRSLGIGQSGRRSFRTTKVYFASICRRKPGGVSSAVVKP